MAFAGLLISWNRATSRHKSHRDTTGVIDAVGMLTFLTGFMAVECHELYLLIPLFIELIVCIWLYARAVRKNGVNRSQKHEK